MAWTHVHIIDDDSDQCLHHVPKRTGGTIV